MPVAEAAVLLRPAAAGLDAPTAAAAQSQRMLAQPLPAAGRIAPRVSAAAADASPRGGALQAARLQHMQRTLGNRAAQRLVARYAVRPLAEPAAQARTEAPATVPIERDTASSPALARPAVQRRQATIQKDGDDDAPWWRALAFGESVAWRLMDEFAPQLVPIVRRGPAGVVDWLGERVTQAAGRAFDGLMRPVRAISGAGAQLAGQFAPVLANLRDAAAKIAANDCSPISQAATKIEQAVERVVTPVVEKLQPVLARVQEFLGAVWDKIGAPILGWIQEYAAQQWAQIRQLATWIWDLTQPMRSLGADAMAWLGRMIGIGDGAESENGILQWAERQLDAAWQRVQAALAPFGRQIAAIRNALATVGGVIAGPFVAIAGLAAQAGPSLVSLARRLGDGRGLLDARVMIQQVLIPPLSAALQRVADTITGAAAGLKAALDFVAGGIDGAAAALADTALSFLVSTAQWIAEQAHALSDWAGQQLANVATALDAAIAGLRSFLQNLGEFLHRVQTVVADVWALPVFLGERIWNWIPACLRDPVIDFVVPLIIRQVELFRDLVRDADAWQRTRAEVMGIVRQVFVTRDLVGAVKSAFHLVLRVFNLPPEMLAKVAAKAMAAWDTVSRRPIEFIKNTVRSLGHGFRLLWNNITTHLEHGIEGWLFGELGDREIRPPASWTDARAIFGFVLDVLGLSISHVLELLRRRIDPALVDRVQTWVGRFARAWDWITNAIDTSRSPAENARGLIDQAKNFGKSILTGVAEWVAGKVTEELAVLAAAAAASGGLSEVLDIARRIYRAMLTAQRWAARILQMASDALDHVLDIASGNVAKVGAEFERLMDRAMPVVIGFLADQVGLGGIGAALREIVDRLRTAVDNAILWLIDRIKAGLQTLVGGIRAGVAAIAAWWQVRVAFTARDGRPHALRFEGPSATELIVESDPTPVRRFLAEVLPLIAASADAATLTDTHREATRMATEVERRTAAVRARGDAADPADVQALTDHINQLGRLLDPLLVLRDGSARDTSSPARSAPGLGRIGSHGSKPPSLRDGPRLHWLESEHIIPFATGKRLWQMVNLAMPGRGGSEDRGQTTIMIYERAARIKTPEDNRISTAFEAALARAQIERRLRGARAMNDAGRPDTLRREGPELLGLMMQGLRVAKDDAVARTNEAIRAENEEHSDEHPLTNGQRRAPAGSAEPPTPSPADTARAAETQYDNVVNLVESRSRR